MSREVLNEAVSAAMDGEAAELELRRLLAAPDEEAAEVRRRWARYQLARDVMHGQPVSPGLDLASAVSAAIAAETAQPAAQRESRRGLRIGRFAVAASVALAVLAGVRWYHQDASLAPQLASQPALQEISPLQPALPVATAPQAPAVLASYPASQAEETLPAHPAGDEQILRALPADADSQPAR